MTKTLYTKALIEKKAEGEFTAVASSELEDRQGEVVKADGWSLKNFKNNPILLWMHDHTKPLGKASRVWVDKTASQLKFKGMISDATEWGRAALQLIDEGILNSFSVGFRPLEMDGNTITKAELFEISLVTVPANPEARLLAAKSLENAGFENDIIKEFTGDKDEIIAELTQKLEQAEEKANKALEMAESAVKGLEHLNPQRSKPSTTPKHLELSKVIVKAADRMVSGESRGVDQAKLIKRTSEKLISNLKKEL